MNGTRTVFSDSGTLRPSPLDMRKVNRRWRKSQKYLGCTVMSKKVVKSQEELLKEVLVTVEEQPYGVPGNWVWVRLVPFAAECLDRFRKLNQYRNQFGY